MSAHDTRTPALLVSEGRLDLSFLDDEVPVAATGSAPQETPLEPLTSPEHGSRLDALLQSSLVTTVATAAAGLLAVLVVATGVAAVAGPGSTPPAANHPLTSVPMAGGPDVAERRALAAVPMAGGPDVAERSALAAIPLAGGPDVAERRALAADPQHRPVPKRATVLAR
jgi:hypothetical protein